MTATHEDPACTDCGGTGESYQAETRCACQPPTVTEAAKIKPCPFCGGSDIRFDAHPGSGNGIYHRGETVYSMCCYDCGATFPNRYRKELLVEAWNRRTEAKP